MRQIATLPDEGAARQFADYLRTLRIEARVDPDGPAFAVWVCDEDQVARAREELEAFQRDPADPRYARATRAAQALRTQEAREEDAYARRQRELAEEMRAPPGRERPLTLMLLATSVLVALTTGFGETVTSPVLQALTIAPYEIHNRTISWQPVGTLLREGEVWRLVTPIFIHYGVPHLLFNMLMLLSLGGTIEEARGTRRFLGLVLLLAVLSNVAEYNLSWSLEANLLPEVQRSPQFGGMSGVLYGLFGYLWMKSRFAPELGLTVSSDTVFIMLGWFVLCLLGVLGAIANVAHAAGLAVGVIVGILPYLTRRLRR